MNRIEFMKQLEALLQNITEAEKVEALQYYADYFEDAGVENEGKIIQELQSPEKVAQIIKSGLEEETQEGIYTETGFKEERFEEKQEVKSKEKPEYKMNSSLKTILIILAVIILTPVVFPILGAILAVICSFYLIIISIFIATICLLVSSVIVIGFGIGSLTLNIGYGIMGIGFGAVLFGIGLLLLIFCITMVRSILPRFVRWIRSCLQTIKRKGGVAR